MLILKNIFSGLTDWWIMLEMKDGSLYDPHHAGKPFKGTRAAVDLYADHLAMEAMKRGLPLKEIHIYPIKRSA